MQTNNLVELVLAWWKEHELDCYGEYGFRVFQNTPKFVKEAMRIKENQNKVKPDYPKPEHGDED